MAVQAVDVSDILKSTLNDLGRGKVTDNSSAYRNTIALKRVFKKGKMEIASSGDEFRFQVLTDTNHSARFVGLAYTANPSIVNTLASGKMPWRHVNASYAMERRLIQMNSGPSMILSEVKKARWAGIGSLIELFERYLWRLPSATTPAAETEYSINMVGIPYFVVKSATAATLANNDGFNGGAPTGYTTVANLNPTSDVNGRWKNYTDAYTAISKEDLIPKMRRAKRHIKFMPLVDGTPEYDTGEDWGIYVNDATIGNLEEILEAQNENLGSDVASMDGKALFSRTPFTPVQELDQDTTNPVYMLNWGVLKAKALANEWMKEEVFDKNPNQPTVIYTNIDCTCNLFCTDRRKLAVISNGTGLPA